MWTHLHASCQLRRLDLPTEHLIEGQHRAQTLGGEFDHDGGANCLDPRSRGPSPRSKHPRESKDLATRRALRLSGIGSTPRRTYDGAINR